MEDAQYEQFKSELEEIDIEPDHMPQGQGQGESSPKGLGQLLSTVEDLPEPQKINFED